MWPVGGIAIARGIFRRSDQCLGCGRGVGSHGNVNLFPELHDAQTSSSQPTASRTSAAISGKRLSHPIRSHASRVRLVRSLEFFIVCAKDVPYRRNIDLAFGEKERYGRGFEVGQHNANHGDSKRPGAPARQQAHDTDPGHEPNRIWPPGPGQDHKAWRTKNTQACYHIGPSQPVAVMRVDHCYCVVSTGSASTI